MIKVITSNWNTVCQLVSSNDSSMSNYILMWQSTKDYKVVQCWAKCLMRLTTVRIINLKDYCNKQVQQLSQSNWSNQFSVTDRAYLASQLMGWNWKMHRNILSDTFSAKYFLIFFTHFLVFGLPEGSPNILKIRQISGGIWQKSIWWYIIILHHKSGDISMQCIKLPTTFRQD